MPTLFKKKKEMWGPTVPDLMLGLSLAANLIYTAWKVRTQVHMLQQNSYRNERYLNWMRKNPGRAFPPKDLLPFAALLPLFWSSLNLAVLIWLLIYVYLLVTVDKTPEKKKLVYTFRVKRLLALLAVVFLVWLLFLVSYAGPAVFFAALVLTNAAAPFWVLLGNTLIRPVEIAVQDWYYRDARRKLAGMKGLKVIGLTGSYGKTSTKHILAKILAAKYNVLMTPESYNTTMGVVRTIREMLKATHEVFVVEMGAMQRGDIKELCDLVAPQYGVLTAIGEQHLETFKTLANIAQTKFELVEAIPEGGIAFLNIDDPNICAMPHTGNRKYIYYGLDAKEAHYRATDISFDARGTTFTVRTPGGAERQFQTKLLGKHNVSNILAGIAVAAELGIELGAIAAAVRDLNPVEHRLSLKRYPNNVTVIDDAFNSNPVGSRNALEVLGAFPGKRKILVTPGMIELGSRYYEANRAFGEYAAAVCDYIILVGEKQTAPIRDGLQGRNFPSDRMYVAKGLGEAVQRLQQILQEGDVVLFENDLPDIFNE